MIAAVVVLTLFALAGLGIASARIAMADRAKCQGVRHVDAHR